MKKQIIHCKKQTSIHYSIMLCYWLVKGTKDYCTRSTKNEYCENNEYQYCLQRRIIERTNEDISAVCF